MIINSLSTWLCTPEQFEAMPVGTQYCVLSSRTDFAGAFSGKMTLIIKDANTTELLTAGYAIAPATFEDGTLVYVDGVTLVTWLTKDFVDPCAGISDENVLRSAVYRGLI